MRACDEVQGTFALTIERPRLRLARSPPAAAAASSSSECVSCGACVQACPTATLQEKTVVELGMPTRSVLTTCAYCGVGCSFKAELRGDQVVRMVPYKDGGANEGHSCVKGRFAFGYASHPDRVLDADDARARSTDPWREVVLGRGDRLHRAPAARDPGRSTASARSAASPRRGAPTRRSTSSRRWCAPRSATTTSTPAPGSATRPPGTG